MIFHSANNFRKRKQKEKEIEKKRKRNEKEKKKKKKKNKRGHKRNSIEPHAITMIWSIQFKHG
jgi:hypothetical protein